MSYNSEDYMENAEKDLAAWKQVEDAFVNSGYEKDLSSRSFKKKKLKEMDRIWYKYGGHKGHSSMNAHMLIVSIQRRKLEKSLYAGLSGWILQMARRGVLRLWMETVGPRDQSAISQTFSIDQDRPRPSSSLEQEHTQGQGQHKGKIQGWDYGPQKQRKPGQGLGM